MNDFGKIILVAALAGGGGYISSEWQSLKQSGGLGGESGSIRIPAELKLTIGEPTELRAETSGKRVVWMSLDPELKLRPLDSKGIWIFATKTGTYRVTAWTSVGNLPTANAVCVVKVEAEKDDKATEQQVQAKEKDE